MVLNIATVAGAVVPDVISTFISHYVSKRSRAQKPTAHISYDQGLALIQRFLVHASHNTVEDLQRFTSQRVPHPNWIKIELVYIPEEHLTTAAQAIQTQLKPGGIYQIGGKTWWQWRTPGSKMSAEWVEMRNNYNQRKNGEQDGNRVMLYVHGGAYFFGSVDVHRYQLQRHARKLKGRVFAPRYRLAPQFPFPCGLLDCLAAYMYLLTIQSPNTIILAGDSAGAGMILSMMVVMRDQGIPLPAGAILISPWVDLTNSFPSIEEENPLDYVPSHGFHQKPSESWPPPHDSKISVIKETIGSDAAHKGSTANQERNTQAPHGVIVDAKSTAETPVPWPSNKISIPIDGKMVEINDQIHMYAPNQLLVHPLVSPVFQPSLGGLPPLFILTGGGEMLRDEQIYLAHKAANPARYVPGDAFLDEAGRSEINRWKPTNVQLQVWDHLCHAAPTLNFTPPAKYMYRSIAQFSTWALTKAQGRENGSLDNDQNPLSLPNMEHNPENDHHESSNPKNCKSSARVGKADDPLPPFKHHMIRQRVDIRGCISCLEPESELAACNLDPSQLGIMKEKLFLKWLDAKRKWDVKYASSKRRIEKQRKKGVLKSYQMFGVDETPPLTALASRYARHEDGENISKSRSMDMSCLRSWRCKYKKKVWGEQRGNPAGSEILSTSCSQVPHPSTSDGAGHKAKEPEHYSSSNTLHSDVIIDRNQTVDSNKTDEAQKMSPSKPARNYNSCRRPSLVIHAPSDQIPVIETNLSPEIRQSSISDQTIADLKLPTAGRVAYPFTLKDHSATTSMLTLTSFNNVEPMAHVQEQAQVLGAEKT